jgi:hypothetical protein
LLTAGTPSLKIPKSIIYDEFDDEITINKTTIIIISFILIGSLILTILLYLIIQVKLEKKKNQKNSPISNIIPTENVYPVALIEVNMEKRPNVNLSAPCPVYETP